VTFEILTIRSLVDGADDALYPRPKFPQSGQLVERDPGDGGRMTEVVATRVTVHEGDGSGGLRPLVRLSDMTADVYVTDCRVVVACARFDKGGGWSGSPVTALALNAVSRARAKSRSRGKVLVGQVRHPWLSSVSVSPKQAWLDDSELRLHLVDRTGGTDRRLVLELTLHKAEDAIALAQEITHRAAVHRLAANPGVDGDGRAALEALVSPPRLDPPPRTFASYAIPRAVPVGTRAEVNLGG
jgi:hypothetical protein